MVMQTLWIQKGKSQIATIPSTSCMCALCVCIIIYPENPKKNLICKKKKIIAFLFPVCFCFFNPSFSERLEQRERGWGWTGLPTSSLRWRKISRRSGSATTLTGLIRKNFLKTLSYLSSGRALLDYFSLLDYICM